MRNLFNDVSKNITPALDNKVDISSIGVANGVAGLDSNGLIPSSQLPSYVDDVLEYQSLSNFPATGVTGKIYVALDTNKTYRWGGSTYIEISESLALGTTSSTAYRGDWGNQVKTKVGTATLTTTAQDVSGAVNELNNALSNKANKKTTIDSYYGTSSTGADTAAKVITVTDGGGNFSLRPGIAIMVKFSVQNTANNPTFNVNNTGAKPVFYNTAAVTTGNLWAGGNTRPARYVYDGTYWVWMGQAIDQNTTYTNMSKAELTTGTATSSRTVRADYLKAGIEELIDEKLPTVPTKLSDLDDDATHRTVSDTEKSTWNGKANKKTQLSAFYGTCTTDAATQAKTATITDSDGNFSLRAGVNIFIKFTNSNTFSVTADTPITLNVNNTGAKQIRSGAYAIATGTNTTYYGRANYINQYIYDGTYWVWAGSSGDNNTTYSNMSAAELTTGTATTQRTVRADYLKTGINSLIDTKIGGLDVASVGGSGKYISAISETDGKISATASNMPTIPDQLSDLTDDSTHRLVTDTEKTTWNDKVDKKTTVDSYYGTSSTAADTAAKVITVTDGGGNFSLRAGISIMVKFSSVNTAQNPTFNVNNTGAKPVFYNTAVVTTGTLWAGGNTIPARYVYDGTNWVWMGQAIDNNTTYTAITRVPNSFITLESGISITTNHVFKQGNHIFGWITFDFSAQTPNNLKLGKLNDGYKNKNYYVMMAAGLGTETGACEYTGYVIQKTGGALYVKGYTSNIKAAYIHLDYVV